MRARGIRIGLALALAPIACGDPLVDGSYPGQPILEAAGGVEIRELSELAMADGRLRVALFWVRSEGWEDVDPSLGVLDIAEQSVQIANLPGVYGFRVYDPAPAEVMVDAAALGGTGHFALASMLVYVDAADDRHFDHGDDWIVGAIDGQVFAFTREGAEIPGLGTLEPGYTALDTVREDGWFRCSDGTIDLTLGEVGTPLVIDFLFSVLVDPNCDQMATEYAICPAPANLDEHCALNPAADRCLPYAHC